MLNYVIVPDPACPEYVPVGRLRRLAQVLLPWFFPRARFVWCPPPQTNRRLIAHPSTVPALKRWLEQRGHTYTQEAPALKPVEARP